jgi:3-dehydroquinate dehydratase type I
MSTEQVVEHLKQLEARGADMVKVAAAANNEEDLLEAMRTTCALKRELKVPFIHILMGQYGKMHRFVGPMLGSSLIFTVQQYTARGHKEQPLVRAAKAVFDNLDWRISRSAQDLQVTEDK